MAVEIPVGKHHVALVDDADAELVRGYKWRVCSSRKHGLKYAAAWHGSGAKTRKTVLMHRLVMGLTWGDRRQVDHEDHDGLNNRRRNLRMANSSQQRGNSRKKRLGDNPSPYATPFRGVFRDIAAKGDRFCARIGVNGRTVALGSFSTLEEAAMRYNVAARNYYGEYAHLNQVSMG